jgi:hypothetical protein
VQQQTITLDRTTNQVVVTPQQGVPQTPAEMRGLQVKIRELNSELQTAAERRNSVSERLREMDVAARPGYIERLAALDKRIMTIENELTVAAQQLAAAPASALATNTTSDERFSAEERAARAAERVAGDLVPIVAILSVFVFAPIALTLSRYIWKRSIPAQRAPVADVATQQRLDQLQQCVDTIAIEVERISENQRFVTRLLSERSVGAGAAEPVPVGKRESAASERS